MLRRLRRSWLRRPVLLLPLLLTLCLLMLLQPQQPTDRRASVSHVEVENSDGEGVDVALLQARANKVWHSCKQDPPPQDAQLKRAAQIQKTSPQLAQLLRSQFFKTAYAGLVNIAPRNLTWCPLPKVASTSWAEALLDLTPAAAAVAAASSLPLQVQLRKMYRASKQPLPLQHSFLYVRHPIQRLVAAYRNKLEYTAVNHDGDYFYSTYGKGMVNKYRSLTDVETYRSLQQQFHEFKKLKEIIQRYLKPDGEIREVREGDPYFSKMQEDVEEYKKLKLVLEKYKEFNDGDPEDFIQRDPTFPEFVEYLLHTDPDRYDEHWKPAYLYCQVCQLKYQFVLKYENFQAETRSLVSYLVDRGVLPPTFSLDRVNSQDTGSDVTRRYMAMIPVNKQIKLLRKFKRDFVLFDYDPDLFL